MPVTIDVQWLAACERFRVTLTGRQIRDARLLMGLQRSKLAERMRIPTALVRLAESADEDCPLTLKRAAEFRSYFENHGIEFVVVDGAPTVRLVVESMVRGSPLDRESRACR